MVEAKNKPTQDLVRPMYVCPKTKQRLYEDSDGLTGKGGIRYKFIRGWRNTSIPDFRDPYELGETCENSSRMYNHAASVGIYRNFLDWLFLTFNQNETSFRNTLIQKLNLEKADRVLVTGCGMGDDVPPILEVIGEEGEVYAQDLSPEMIVAASNHVMPTHPAAKVYFSVGNAERLPFVDDFFDGAFHFGGINLFGDIRLSISEMERLVKSGGRVVFGDEGIAPWLKDTEYARVATTTNALWKAEAPIDLLPFNALDVNLSWVLGNCFYVISFEVSKKGPYMNLDVPLKSPRGGSMRSRYFG